MADLPISLLAPLLDQPGLPWLLLGVVLAGLARGFAGFGTAMIYLPFAGQFMGPFAALTTLIVMDLVGPLVHVPRAWREGHPPDVARLGLGLACAMPLGFALLAMVTPETFRWAVSVTAFVLVALLLSGWRYGGRMRPGLVYATGGTGGLLGGLTGLVGPPVILLYMASPLPAAAIRANITMYLILSDVVLLALMAGTGRLEGGAVLLGLWLILPYTLANMAGAAIFRPGRDRLYRGVAYLMIAASALSGLPLWD